MYRKCILIKVHKIQIKVISRSKLEIKKKTVFSEETTRPKLGYNVHVFAMFSGTLPSLFEMFWVKTNHFNIGFHMHYSSGTPVITLLAYNFYPGPENVDHSVWSENYFWKVILLLGSNRKFQNLHICPYCQSLVYIILLSALCLCIIQGLLVFSIVSFSIHD